MSDDLNTDPAGHAPERAPSEPRKGNGAGHRIDEVPEEADEQSGKVNPAAAADKFKKFADMRRDPKSALAPVTKKLTSIPARTPHRNWFVRTSLNPDHQGILPLFWDKGADGVPYLVDPSCQDLLENVNPNYCVLTTLDKVCCSSGAAR